MNRPRHVCALVCGIIFLAAAVPAQPVLNSQNSIRSFSGQFIVTALSGFSPFSHHPLILTNNAFVRLEPTLLAVSAERIKTSLCREIGLAPEAVGGGKIFLVLHPAHSPDDDAVITARPFLREWNCRVELPDVMLRQRYARTLTGALLLEIANQDAAFASRFAEIPSWLADGLAAQILAKDGAKILLSSPSKQFERVPLTRLDETRRFDALADVRRTLQNVSALTFEQLSWPTPAQLAGEDGGAYLASAQLFTDGLLALKNGPSKLRAMLRNLSARQNWQTAFFAAFQENFSSALEVEKWWSLRVVNFAGRDPGPGWTPAVSQERLEELLSVPVSFRADSNSLPIYTSVSLQEAIRNFEPAQRTALLQPRLRDLEIARFRLSPAFAQLADGYCTALADFLGAPKNKSRTGTTRALPMRKLAGVADTLKKLDALDVLRRDSESKMRYGVMSEKSKAPPR